MTLAAFLAAILALLLAPGPTNTLMAVAGAQRGPLAALRLLPAEIAGYLTAILPLAFLGAPLMAAFPLAASVLKLAAALWVLVLAVRLWRQGGAGAAIAGRVTAMQLYATTALNPKALVFALVLLPAPFDPAFAPRLAAFVLAVAGVAALWSFAGGLAQRGLPQGLVPRLASVWLGAVAVGLALGAAPA